MTIEPAASSLDAVDLTHHELFRHGFPHEVFRRLREEAPLWRHPDTPGTEPIGGGILGGVPARRRASGEPRSCAVPARSMDTQCKRRPRSGVG